MVAYQELSRFGRNIRAGNSYEAEDLASDIGTHQSLMAKKDGYYARMYESQKEWYSIT